MNDKLYIEIKNLSQSHEIKRLLEMNLNEIDRIYAIQRYLMVIFISESDKRFTAEAAYILSMAIILSYYIDYNVISNFYPRFYQWVNYYRMGPTSKIEQKLALYSIISRPNMGNTIFEYFNSYIFTYYFNRDYHWQVDEYDRVKACTDLGHLYALECNVSDIKYENDRLYNDIIKIRNMIA